jgi:hypothetical protein
MKKKKSSEGNINSRTRNAEQLEKPLDWSQFWKRVTRGTHARSEIRDQAQFMALSGAQNQLLR